MTSQQPPSGSAADRAPEPPAISLRLPEIFEQVPSPDGTPEEAEQWDHYVDQALPSYDEAPDLPREEIKQQYAAMRRAEAAQGVVGSAVCCEQIDERATLAYLTVALAPSQHDDPVVAAEGLYHGELDKAAETDEAVEFAADGDGAVAGRFTSPGRLVLAVDLPAGPAVTVITRQIIAAAPTEQYPEGLEVPAGTIQVFIPAPARYVATLTLMTPTPDDLDDYAEMMASIASTIEFDEDGPD